MSVNPLEPVVPQPPQTGASTAPEANVPLQQKYGGDWAKANAGYFEAANTLSKVTGEREAITRERDAIAERNKQLEAYVAQSLGMQAGNLPPSNDPLAPLQSELGLPIEPFRKGIHAEVFAAVAELMKPVLQSVQADETLEVEIPNYGQLKVEARKVMAENPEVAENFKVMQASDPVRAWKYAIREAALAKASGPAPPPRSAGLPGSAAPSGRSEANPSGPSAEETEKAGWDYYRQFGDSRPATSERYKGTSVERAVNDALRHLGVMPPDGGSPQRW